MPECVLGTIDMLWLERMVLDVLEHLRKHGRREMSQGKSTQLPVSSAPLGSSILVQPESLFNLAFPGQQSRRPLPQTSLHGRQTILYYAFSSRFPVISFFRAQPSEPPSRIPRPIHICHTHLSQTPLLLSN